MTNIFIVDDQKTNLRILSTFANTLGEEIAINAFESPMDALTALNTGPPDLVITDYVMPVMSGSEFIRLFREHAAGAEVPIIVITAYEDREFRYKALEAGASDFLLSPVDGREFVMRARNMLTLQRQRAIIRRRAERLAERLESTTEQMYREISEREYRLKKVIDTVPALISASDAGNRLVFVNRFHRQLLGRKWESAEGKLRSEVFTDDYAERHGHLDSEAIGTGNHLTDIEETLVDINGKPREFLTTKAPLKCYDGVTHVVTVSIDITERKHQERNSVEHAQKFQNLVNGSVLGVVILADERPLYCNVTFARMFGFDQVEDLLALPTFDRLYAPDSRARLIYYQRGWARGDDMPTDYEFEGRTRSGQSIWLQAQAREVMWEGRPALQLTVADITLRKQYEEELERQANFDELTGLPKRVLASDRLLRAVAEANATTKVGVLYLDLDHFKRVNDTLGHEVGDHLLRLAARRLTACVDDSDTVARFGGDEFIVILPRAGGLLRIEMVARAIIREFSVPFDLDGLETTITASIGIAVAPDDGTTPEELLRKANSALYEVKDRGRNGINFYTRELFDRTLRRMRLDSLLRAAVRAEEFTIVYQPILDLRDGTIRKAEALLRWQNAEYPDATTEEIVTIAEETGLILPLGQSVIESVCQQLSAWRRAGVPVTAVSINVASAQMRDPGFAGLVIAAGQRHQIPYSCLEFEITERVMIDDFPQVHHNIRQLNAVGARIVIDDFGVGYSALSYLNRFRLDGLKIDRSFMAPTVAPGNRALVEAMIAMAKCLELVITAEGIENADQLEFIRQCRCHYAQGYHISRPLAAADIDSLFCQPPPG